jgi:cytidine deaminase
MTDELSSPERNKLIHAARRAALGAYAPYSGFRVGAAVLGRKGIVIGVNVENASYGLSLCAERAALASTITKGEKHIRAIAIACIDAAPDDELSELLPCGACRQWMVELAPGAQIIVCGGEKPQTFTVDELLPKPFRIRRRKNG